MFENKTLVTDYLRTLSGRPKTPELVRQYVADERLATHIAETEAAFPCYQVVVEDLLAEGNKVVVRGEFRGIHRGSFARIEPTGKSVRAGLMVIYAIAIRRIVDHWMQFDLHALGRQLQGECAAASA